VYSDARANPKRVVFAEAEEEVVLRAAIQFRDGGYGTPVLVGREQRVRDKLKELAVDDPMAFEIHNSVNAAFGAARWSTVCTNGSSGAAILKRDCQAHGQPGPQRLRRSAAGALGDADAMLTGMTRTFGQSLRDVRRVLDPKPGEAPFRHPS
jgi:malate dehydrogenase (oxaloacetate-decarboxylating)(NADP+)